ncbi:DUF2808 domain-containing protein [Candidatus Cyanaurora vandensis]|uniref:DUF2808 domain-containing protein n=1 Tax=Candidatus Cyanaurora vandensis TaxID=2714958 RepID=UPI00257F6000|nr:DUF2808 domain-containing protein [Candidatus Cyanaurora vandensis]
MWQQVCTLGLVGLLVPVGAYPVAFETALKLQPALALNDVTRYGPTSYQFNVAIPARVQTSLARLTITVPDDAVPFGINLPRPEEVLVYVPSNPGATGPRSIGQQLPATISLRGRTVMVDFLSPPTGYITIEFQQMRNPEVSGVYLFEVQALPVGTQPISQFVGYGRITFQSPGGSQ